ncbi:hypothetical protein Tco_0838896 [Tanacetum coccineum]|uniref:Uncharacterized protein n=1 Tax=Tanacetum coccineum TaxID=301880 RepID=A0ABQ5AU59_9ASTR
MIKIHGNFKEETQLIPCSRFYPVPLTDGTDLPERRELADLQNNYERVFWCIGNEGKNVLEVEEVMRVLLSIRKVVVKWNDGGFGDEVVVKEGGGYLAHFVRFGLRLQGDGRSLGINQVLTTLDLYLRVARVKHSSYFLS